MYTYKLTLAYDGTAYAGWQRQPNQPTIQATIETVLAQLTQQPISVIAAGRTDAGVHAVGQVASFHTAKYLTIGEWLRALNGLLPRDIGVTQIEAMPTGFHARYSAICKRYDYRLFNASMKPVLERDRLWHIPQSLNLTLMQQAASFLIGRQDFSSFENSPTDNTNPFCDIQHLHLIQDHHSIVLHIQADRFLKQMVRTIVGTLVEVGHQKRHPLNLKDILQARDRRSAGKTAPPHGLYLMSVDYGKS